MKMGILNLYVWWSYKQVHANEHMTVECMLIPEILD